MTNFYSTVDNFKAYHAERGNDVTGFTDAQIQERLVTASEYVDGCFLTAVSDFYYKTGGRDQIRVLPVAGLTDKYGYAIPNNEVPREVVAATNEAAFYELSTPGILFRNYTPNQYQRVSVDGAISVQYRDYVFAADFQTKFTKLDKILEPLLSHIRTGNSNNGTSIRA